MEAEISQSNHIETQTKIRYKTKWTSDPKIRKERNLPEADWWQTDTKPLRVKTNDRSTDAKQPQRHGKIPDRNVIRTKKETKVNS